MTVKKATADRSSYGGQARFRYAKNAPPFPAGHFVQPNMMKNLRSLKHGGGAP
jgi:hypothetical protein